MGAAERLGHDPVDDAERLQVRAVIRIASAASAALSAVRHRIEAQPSGEITE